MGPEREGEWAFQHCDASMRSTADGQDVAGGTVNLHRGQPSYCSRVVESSGSLSYERPWPTGGLDIARSSQRSSCAVPELRRSWTLDAEAGRWEPKRSRTGTGPDGRGNGLDSIKMHPFARGVCSISSERLAECEVRVQTGVASMSAGNGHRDL